MLLNKYLVWNRNDGFYARDHPIAFNLATKNSLAQIVLVKEAKNSPFLKL